MNLGDPAAAEAPTPTVSRLASGEFDQGPGYATYRSRGTTDWLLMHTLDGEGRLGSAGPDVRALPGTTSLIRPATRHDYGVEPVRQHWHFLYAHFHPRPDWQPLLAWPQAAPGIGQLATAPATADAVTAALRECVRHNASSARNRELLAVNALERALLLCDGERGAGEQCSPPVRAALDLIEAELPGDLTVARLAAAASLSVSRFAHLFRAELGVSPQRYTERRRLESAARLLDLGSRPVAAVAAAVGFGDPFYFSTRFRRWYGLSPRDYRARRYR